MGIVHGGPQVLPVIIGLRAVGIGDAVDPCVDRLRDVGPAATGAAVLGGVGPVVVGCRELPGDVVDRLGAVAEHDVAVARALLRTLQLPGGTTAGRRPCG